MLLRYGKMGLLDNLGQGDYTPSQYTPAATPPQYTPSPPQYTPEPPQYTPEPPQYTPSPPQYTPSPPQYTPEPPQYTPSPPQYTPTYTPEYQGTPSYAPTDIESNVQINPEEAGLLPAGSGPVLYEELQPDSFLYSAGGALGPGGPSEEEEIVPLPEEPTPKRRWWLWMALAIGAYFVLQEV